jgi:hypothetical protein
MLCALISGITTLLSNYANAQNSRVYFGGAFFSSCGLGLLVAYLLSLKFPPRLY